MTVRIDDEVAAFVDHAAGAGEGSRAEVINRAVRREMRRRQAQRDAQIYVKTVDLDLESDAYAVWSHENAMQAWGDLD